jgi:hypothetical protein
VTPTPAIRIGEISAIDVHVHLEAPDDHSSADRAARKYFGESGAARDAEGLAEYYRSRRMAFVIFSVDERLSGARSCRTTRSRTSRARTPTSPSRSPASIRTGARTASPKRGGSCRRAACAA